MTDASVDDALPLSVGDSGEAVSDLQRRLESLNITCAGDEPSVFGNGTLRAVQAFQDQRCLDLTGICDITTWSALVEAGYRFGARHLYRRSPMFRGDDVEELQQRLSALGFDPGRIDGIFGEQTYEALIDFQRNAGLRIDGIYGRKTHADLLRLQPLEGGAELVSTVRERLRVATAGQRGLGGRRIGVGEPGGFPAGVAAVCRALHDSGAMSFAFHHPDPSTQAIEANAAEVDCFISLVIAPDEQSCSTAYYRGYRYESLASRRLAESVQLTLPHALGLHDAGIRGLALPILRETRMPAIEIQLGAPIVIVQHTAELARILLAALSGWITESYDSFR